MISGIFLETIAVELQDLKSFWFGASVTMDKWRYSWGRLMCWWWRCTGWAYILINQSLVDARWLQLRDWRMWHHPLHQEQGTDLWPRLIVPLQTEQIQVGWGAGFFSMPPIWSKILINSNGVGWSVIKNMVRLIVLVDNEKTTREESGMGVQSRLRPMCWTCWRRRAKHAEACWCSVNGKRPAGCWFHREKATPPEPSSHCRYVT